MQDINSLLQTATGLHRQGQREQADKIYRKILDLSPTFSPALNMLGILTAQSGKPSDALELFRQAIASAPNDPAAHENLGRTFSSLHRHTEAASAYRQAVRLNPDSYASQLGLATALHANQLYKDALATFEQARRLRADDPILYLYMGAASQHLQQYANAETHFRQALELAPESIDANACMANLLLQQQDMTQAEGYFARARELGAQRPDIEFGFAQTLESRGDEDAARKHYIRACELDPASQNAYIQLDQFLLKSGGTEKTALLDRLLTDHIYTDWQDSINDMRALAALYEYPDTQAVSALNNFIDQYHPGELYNREWWERQLSEFGGPGNTHDKLLRSLHSAVYCWSLPDRESLSEIAVFIGNTRLCSFGAGTGVWERLLQQHFNVDVAASDLCLRHRFLPMVQADYSSTEISPTDTIFLAWIVRGDTGVMQLIRQIQPGQKLVLVGEPPDQQGIPRICGTPELWTYLSDNFILQREINLVSYSLMNDTACLFTRNSPEDPK